MKKCKTLLVSVLSVILLVCMGLFVAACDNETPDSDEKTYYTVTVAEYDESQGTVALEPAVQDGKYEENASVSVVVTPKSGYEVDAVKANDAALTANGEGKYAFSVKGDTTVTVTFKSTGTVTPPVDETVNVTVDCGENGSYTLDPAPTDGKVKKGASVTLTVTANANYEVDSVQVNGSPVELTENKYTFTADTDTAIVITFKSTGTVTPPVDETVNVTVDCGENGSYTLDPAPEDGKVKKGASVTLTVTAGANYEVDSVQVNGSPVELTESKYTFTADEDTAIVITFKSKQVSVTVDYQAEQGSVTSDTLSEDGTVASGTEVTLTIEPAYGYEIVSVTVNGDDVTDQLEELLLLPDRPDLNMREHSPKRNLKLGALTEDTAIAVTFQEATHKITLTVEGPGTCELFDATEEEVKLTNLNAVPASTKIHAKIDCVSTKYIVAELHVNDGETDLKMSIVSGNSFFWVVGKDLTVTVTFTIDREKAPQNKIELVGTCENGSYTLKAEDGMILEDNVFYGEGEATITLVPDEGYIVESFTLYVDEHYYIPQDVTADLVDNSYTFPVTATVQLKIAFKKFEAVTPDAAYLGTSWQCAVSGETKSTTNIAITASAITITGTDIVTIMGTPYTATFGYTVYVEGIEENYVVCLVSGLNDNVLALTIDGASTTYFLKTSPKPTLPEVTFDEALENSSWYGGAAGMPIKFEFGVLQMDNAAVTVLAGTEQSGTSVYTVYANGSLYQLIYTAADDSLVLHPYGESTEGDLPYVREKEPDPSLVPEYAGKYSNNEHTVDIDAEGNFSFDGTVYKLIYNEETKDYSFRTSSQGYTVQFLITGSLKIFNAGADIDWTLKKIEEGTEQYTLTVTCPEDQGTVAYSVKNAENKYWAGSAVTLTVTANKGYEVDQVTVNSESKTLSSAGKLTVTINADTTVVITFKEVAEDTLLSEKYIGVYQSGATTVTITATGVTVKNTDWGVNVTFTAAQITHTGDGQFTLQNGNKKFTFKFTNENATLTVGDPNWAMNGNKTLTKQS